MPSTRSGNPQYYSELRQYYRGLPANSTTAVYASQYRNRDGSWNWSAMTGSSDTHRVRGRPVFTPRPGSERIQFWFYSRGWYIRFNPTVTEVARTDYNAVIGTDVYYYGNSTTASYPGYNSGLWSTSNVMRWFGGLRYYMLQAHNNVAGYRATLGYVWNINSDERLKTNIKYIGDVSGHRIYTWKWNELGNALGEKGRSSGVIAQEVKEYMPEAVTMNPNGYYQVNYRMLGLNGRRGMEIHEGGIYS